LDIRGRILREQGILAEGLERGQAQSLVHSLQGMEIPVLMAPESEIVDYPPVETLRQVEIYDERLVLRLGEKIRREIDWDKIWMFNVSRVKFTETVERSSGHTFYPVAPQGLKVNTQSVRSRVREETRRTPVLDVFLSEPMVHLRLFEEKLRLEEGPGDIRHLARQRASLLSGGERRRLEISRVLSTDPAFILLDEPFAGIDPLAIVDIQNIIAHLTEKNIGVMISDHNVRETLGVCDRAYILNNGRVIESGSPEQIAASETARRIYLGDGFEL